MKKQILNASLFLFYSLLSFNIVTAQLNRDSLISAGMTLTLKNDTLYSSTGLKFYAGQKLIVGNPTGNDSYFRSVIHKSAAIVPSIWGQNKDYENAIENHVNKKKSRELVKKYLLPGDSLIVQRLTYSKTGKPYFYMLSFSTANSTFNCDIKLALLLGELLLIPAI